MCPLGTRPPPQGCGAAPRRPRHRSASHPSPRRPPQSQARSTARARAGRANREASGQRTACTIAQNRIDRIGLTTWTAVALGPAAAVPSAAKAPAPRRSVTPSGVRSINASSSINGSTFGSTRREDRCQHQQQRNAGGRCCQQAQLLPLSLSFLFSFFSLLLPPEERTGDSRDSRPSQLVKGRVGEGAAPSSRHGSVPHGSSPNNAQA